MFGSISSAIIGSTMASDRASSVVLKAAPISHVVLEVSHVRASIVLVCPLVSWGGVLQNGTFREIGGGGLNGLDCRFVLHKAHPTAICRSILRFS